MLLKQNGIDSSRFPYAGEMPDEDDRVFYEVCLSKEDSFLVTGNLKHFPKEPQVITAAEMMEILDNELQDVITAGVASSRGRRYL